MKNFNLIHDHKFENTYLKNDFLQSYIECTFYAYLNRQKKRKYYLNALLVFYSNIINDIIIKENYSIENIEILTNNKEIRYTHLRTSTGGNNYKININGIEENVSYRIFTLVLDHLKKLNIIIESHLGWINIKTGIGKSGYYYINFLKIFLSIKKFCKNSKIELNNFLKGIEINKDFSFEKKYKIIIRYGAKEKDILRDEHLYRNSIYNSNIIKLRKEDEFGCSSLDDYHKNIMKFNIFNIKRNDEIIKESLDFVDTLYNIYENCEITLDNKCNSHKKNQKALTEIEDRIKVWESTLNKCADINKDNVKLDNNSRNKSECHPDISNKIQYAKNNGVKALLYREIVIHNFQLKKFKLDNIHRVLHYDEILNKFSGGRYYSLPNHLLKRYLKPYILINGKATVEIDIVSAVSQIISLLEGFPTANIDFYSFDKSLEKKYELNRTDIKQAFQLIQNSANKKVAIQNMYNNNIKLLKAFRKSIFLKRLYKKFPFLEGYHFNKAKQDEVIFYESKLMSSVIKTAWHKYRIPTLYDFDGLYCIHDKKTIDLIKEIFKSKSLEIFNMNINLKIE